MSLPAEPLPPASSAVDEATDEPRTARSERAETRVVVEAIWHPGGSPDAYQALLRLLFQPIDVTSRRRSEGGAA